MLLLKNYTASLLQIFTWGIVLKTLIYTFKIQTYVLNEFLN